MKVVLIVVDGFGIGGATDAASYGDAGSDTYGNLLRTKNFKLKNLRLLGLDNIDGINNGVANPQADYARLHPTSNGKDTLTGHYEMMGVKMSMPFKTFPNGFSQDIISQLEKVVQGKVLGNCVASGTEIIQQLGQQHIEQGGVIVYTSADSVMQIAAHTDVVPLDRLYEICSAAREIMKDENLAARIIARPFNTVQGSFVRTADRKDFSVKIDQPTDLDILAKKTEIVGIGKIYDIFSGKGITKSYHTVDNDDGLRIICQQIRQGYSGFIFANLNDTDSKYGHRNDAMGYINALKNIDNKIDGIVDALKTGDMLLITADHGCDPTTQSTDHSRECVPFLKYVKGQAAGKNLGTINGFDYVGKTVKNYFNID